MEGYMNGVTRCVTGVALAAVLASAPGTIGCGAGADTMLEKAEAVEVTFYYLPG